MNWLPLVVIAFLGLLALVPGRRLQLAGWSQAAAVAYSLVVWLLAAVLLLNRGAGARWLLPLLVILWIWPFVTWREGLDRLLGRERPREPKNVTPAEATTSADRDDPLDGHAIRVREVPAIRGPQDDEAVRATGDPTTHETASR